MILSAWLPWLLPMVAVPFVPLVGLASRRIRGWFAVIVTGISFLFAAYGALTFNGVAQTESYSIWLPSMSIPLQVTVDGFSVLVASFVSFVSLLIVIFSIGYMQKEGGEGLSRYYSLILLFIGAMLGLVMAGNLIQFYFFWEIVGVCSALLIAFWSEKESARKAGMKAFVVTRIGDAALLIAVLFTWFTFHTTDFSAITSAATGIASGSLVLLSSLVLVGAMGKSAQVPLHVWLPDAMEGPTTVSALIHAATMVNAGVILMVKMLPVFQAAPPYMLSIVILIGLLSALVGGVCAFASEDIKRVLAYSTISQLGIMFVAVGLGSGVAATYHMVSQGLFKALAFLAAGSVITAIGTRDMEQMGGLRHRMKYTYIGFLLAMLAMSGLPPLIGFWSKDAVLGFAINSNLTAAVGLLLAFLLTALYSFRALLKVFHGQPRSQAPASESPPVMIGPILVLATSVVVAWGVLYPQSLVSFSSLGLPDALSATASLAALAAGFVIAYAAFSLYTSRAAHLVASSTTLTSLRSWVVGGLGFDRVYNAAYWRGLVPLGGYVARLQTGELRSNVALVVLTLAAVFALFALGVI